MKEIRYQAQQGTALSPEQVNKAFDIYVESLTGNLKNILLLPPDGTRKHSGAGQLTRILYNKLKERSAVTIMPATGTHRPMTDDELSDMFGDIPLDIFSAHQWRADATLLGIIPSQYIQRISSNALTEAVEVSINQRLLSNEFDRIVSIGQVVPHEVVGMANYSKNILVGAGGEEIINTSHFLGAVHGLERLIGRDHSPVRKLFDYAQEAFLDQLPIDYVLTVNRTHLNEHTGQTDLLGLFIGRDRRTFEAAVALSQQHNITYLPEPIKKFIVYLPPAEFRSTWVGFKAIYRTRLAVADEGEIVVIAPGLTNLGEDACFDRLIQKYGYSGTSRILGYVRENADLRDNLAVAAHLIHGSSEGRFKVTFASDAIHRDILEHVHLGHMSLRAAQDRYGYPLLRKGMQYTAQGEQVYYVHNPAAGLWVTRDKFTHSDESRQEQKRCLCNW